MFGFGNKMENIFMPVNGEVVVLSTIHDPTFSTKMMGDGFAVIPSDGKVFSPVKGQVTSVFPTKHAITIKTSNKRDVLVHMGLDTVELEGNGFMLAVSEGDQVDHTTQLVTVDLQYLAEKQKENPIVVVFPDNPMLKVTVTTGTFAAGATIGSIE